MYPEDQLETAGLCKRCVFLDVVVFNFSTRNKIFLAPKETSLCPFQKVSFFFRPFLKAFFITFPKEVFFCYRRAKFLLFFELLSLVCRVLTKDEYFFFFPLHMPISLKRILKGVSE